MAMNFVKIPKERIAVLVGQKGEVKLDIEMLTGVRLEIDSETGDVTIDATKVKDPSIVLKMKDLVTAVGRGFPPEKAMRVLDDDIYFTKIDIRDFAGKSIKHQRRIRARIIGTSGKTRRLIEELSETDISIYGTTVCIIGPLLELDIARSAVEMVLQGSEHSSVYNFLERKRRDLKLRTLDSY